MASDDQVPALAAGLERVTRRVDSLTSRTDTVEKALAVLLKGPAKEKEPFVPTFIEQPPAAVIDLLDWLEAVYLSYDGAELAPCWTWHPGVVEELAVLRGAHQAVYAGRDWLRIGDWHDRYRPGVVRRVSASLKNCDIAKHHPTPGKPCVPLADALGAVAAARGVKAPVPAPTETQMDRARALDQRRFIP